MADFLNMIILFCITRTVLFLHWTDIINVPPNRISHQKKRFNQVLNIFNYNLPELSHFIRKEQDIKISKYSLSQLLEGSSLS